MTDNHHIRGEVYRTAMQAAEAGLVYLATGNISARTPAGHIAITPSGIRYADLKPEQVAVVDVDGGAVDAPCKSSSETPMHTYIYRALPDVQAVVHTHSSYAITFASLGESIPLANVEIFLCGGPIPVGAWACPGTMDAGERVTGLLKQQQGLKVVLLKNHGLVAVGGSLQEALDAAYHAEMGMKAYHLARQIGQPELLSNEQIMEIKTTYGIL